MNEASLPYGIFPTKTDLEGGFDMMDDLEVRDREGHNKFGALQLEERIPANHLETKEIGAEVL